MWANLLKYLEIKFILVKLLTLNKHYRDVVTSHNSRLFNVFLERYAMCKRLQRSDIPARVSVLPFLRQLEYNMAQARVEHRKADEVFQQFMDKDQKNKKKKVLKKSLSFLAKPEQDDAFLEFGREQFIVGQ